VNIKKEHLLFDYNIESLTTSDANKFVGDLKITSNKTESINIVQPKQSKTASWQDIIISYPTVFGESMSQFMISINNVSIIFQVLLLIVIPKWVRGIARLWSPHSPITPQIYA